MPRILRVINRLNLGGPAYNAAYLTKFLEPEFETLLVSGIKDETEASSEYIVNDLGLHPVYIPEMYRELHPIRDLKSYQTLKEIIREYKPDIVHTHAAKAGAVGRLAALHCNVPVIVHTFHGHVFHSYFNKIKTKAFLQIERHLAFGTTKIVALSPIQKRELCEQYVIAPSEKVEIIPLGFDLTKFKTDQESKRKKFRLQFNIDNDEIAIGIIGRLVPIKNHSMFLNVIKLVSEATSTKIRAYIIGDGEERKKLEETARVLELSFNNNNFREKSQVTFTSWIREIDECIAGLDIIALTSDNEGTPVSLIEAQAAGKPIVSTNVGGIMDILTKSETTLLAEKGDIKVFSEHLLKLIDFVKSDIGHSLISSKLVNNSFGYRELCLNMASLYMRLLDNFQKRGIKGQLF